MRVIIPEVNPLPPFLSAAEFSQGTGGRVDSEDPRVDPLLRGASAAIRRYCGWHVAPMVEETLTLDYDGSGVLILPTLRLVSVEDVVVRGIPVSDVEWSASGEIRLPGGLGSGWRTVQVTVTHGFHPDEAQDVLQVAQQAVANAVASPMGATVERANQVSVQWGQTAPGVSGGLSLLARDLATLDGYKIAKGA